MTKCFICGVYGGDVPIFKAIVKEGIIDICESCSFNENIPIINKPKRNFNETGEKRKSVYEILSKKAGVDPEIHKSKFTKDHQLINKQNETLRKIIERRKELIFPDLKNFSIQDKPDLIRNYHWVLFQARRNMRITQRQLAEEIAESEETIRLAERGILPNNYYPLIRKFQTYFGINFFNDEFKGYKEKSLNIDNFTAKNITISDVKQITPDEHYEDEVPWWKKLNIFRKKKKSEQVPVPPEEVIYNDEANQELLSTEPTSTKEEHSKPISSTQPSFRREEFRNKQTLTKEEIDKILFGKR